MRRIAVLIIVALAVCSCGISTPSDLYYWGGWTGTYTTAYEDKAYRNYKNQSPESICNLICVYEDMVNNPGGKRNVPPPGICAEYAYLLLQPDTARTFEQTASDSQKKMFTGADYGALFREKGASLFEMEMKNYPESALFIMPLVKKMTGREE